MSDSPKESCSLCQKYGLKPITRHNIAFYYAPAFGVVNYTVLSVNVMNPSLIMKLFPSRDITNVILGSSIIGSTLYIYNRPHMQGAPQSIRVLYSGYNSLMFNMGSVLLWAVLKSVAPKSKCISTIIGLLATCGLLYSGQKCLDYIDSRLQPAK